MNYNGSFSLTAVSSVTDTATLTTGAASNSATFTDSVQITVNPVNDAPVVAHALVAQNTAQGAPFSYQFTNNSFNDVDGDTLTYTPTLATGDPLPGWLHFDSSTRTFSGSPPDVETLHVNVVASDGNFSVTSAFDIVVVANHAPTASPVTFSYLFGDEAILTLAGTDQDAGDSVRYKFTHIPAGVHIYLDAGLQNEVVENQIIATDTVYVDPSFVNFPAGLTYVAVDSYLAQSAPATVTAEAPSTATFTGTSGNDVADASASILTGFTLTGSTSSAIGMLRDIAGDIFIPGDGVDKVVGGRGDDTIKIASSTNIGAGDIFQGGAGTNTIDIGATTTVDLREATITNFTVLTGGSADNVVSMTLDQFLHFGSINLGGGTNKIDIYLPSFGNDPDAAATSLDVSSLPLPTLTGVGTINLYPTGSGSKYLVLSQAQFSAFAQIDLGAGNNDTLVINASGDFTMPENHVLNAEKVIIQGAGFASPGAGHTIIGSSQSETILGSRDIFNADREIIIGSGGNDYLDGGANIDTYKFFGTSGGTTTINDTASSFAPTNSINTFDTLVLDNSSLPSGSPYMTFDVTRDGSTLTFKFGNETIIDQGGIDYIASYLPSLGVFNTFGYSIVDGLSGTNALVVGATGDDNISGSGLLFGGDGKDTLTAFGTSSLVGGRGNDTLIGTGSDTTYIFRPGDGNDSITDNWGFNDLLVLDSQGAAFTNLSFFADDLTSNMIVKYGSDEITLYGQFSGIGEGVRWINFNGGSFAGYDLGTGRYSISPDTGLVKYPYVSDSLVVGAKDTSTTLRGDFPSASATHVLMFGGDLNDFLYAGAAKDLMFGGGGPDNFIFSAVNSSTASVTDVIADFQDGVDSIDFSFIPGGTSFANLSFSYDVSHNMTVVTDNVTGIVIDLYGQHTLAASDFTFENVSAVFRGTSGNDIAIASPQTLTGFTGGIARQVSDSVGDLYIPGGGDDVIHAGAQGSDTVEFDADTDISAGDIFDGGYAPFVFVNDAIFVTTAYIDLRPAIIVNFESLYGNNNSNTIVMSFNQYLQFVNTDLGGGTNIVNVYLPSSINSADLDTAPTPFDIRGSTFMPIFRDSVNLLATGSGNQSVTMSSSEARSLSSIDLGDGTQDALTIVMDLPVEFSVNPGLLINVEHLTIIDGSGSDAITAWTGNDSIYGNDGDDTLIGLAGDDYLDGGTGRNQFLIGANDGHDTIAYAAGGTRQIVVSGSYMYSPSTSLDIIHTGTHDLQITYGGTIVDLKNYTEDDSLNIAGDSGNGYGYPFLYHTDAFGSVMTFHDGLAGSDNRQILVGTDGVDHINGVGYGNLMFGGIGNDVITGGNVLAGTDAAILGSSDIYVGGKGDDTLINYGVGDSSGAPGAAISASDTYVFNVGDGNDTIKDYGGGDIQSNLYGDRILIDTKGAAFTTFSMTHDPSAVSGKNDLVIHYGANDSITVWDQFANNGHSMEFINFNGASYDGYNFGNLDYTINKAGVLPLTGSSGGVIVVGDLNAQNDLMYRSYNGNAVLIGGNQDDKLDFDSGGGLMLGGGGADTFVFARAQVGTGTSIIGDFSSAEHDKIDMSGMGLDFASLVLDTTAADGLTVHASTFSGTIDIKLYGVHSLTANDFILT